MEYFDNKLLETIDIEEVTTGKSFPWVPIHGVLTQEGFEALHRDFPSQELFQYHENIIRGETQQRTHDRYYASYQVTPYPELVKETGKGLLKPQNLGISWQEFIEELTSSRAYYNFVSKLLGTNNFGINIAWHIGITGNDISPHLDTKYKLGTHLIYFNTSDDWNPEWGGEFLILDNLSKNVNNPEITDFVNVTEIPIINNRSLIFKNTNNAWHGVKPLQCPEGKLRRLVNIIFTQKK